MANTAYAAGFRWGNDNQLSQNRWPIVQRQKSRYSARTKIYTANGGNGKFKYKLNSILYRKEIRIFFKEHTILGIL